MSILIEGLAREIFGFLLKTLIISLTCTAGIMIAYSLLSNVKENIYNSLKIITKQEEI